MTNKEKEQALREMREDALRRQANSIDPFILQDIANNEAFYNCVERKMYTVEQLTQVLQSSKDTRWERRANSILEMLNKVFHEVV
jgi:esterase/lipase